MAVAQDTFVKAVSGANTQATVTASITVANVAGRVMLIQAYGGYQKNNNVSGVTVNGNAATRIADVGWNGGVTYMSVFRYLAPPTGTYDVIASVSSAPTNESWNRIAVMAVVVNGADDTAIDAYGTNGLSNTSTPSVTFTTVASNAAAYLFVGGEGGPASAGTNSVYVTDNADAASTTLLKSSPYAISPAGSYTIGATFTLTTNWGAVAVSIAPARASSSIKTVNGLAKTSVKTINGLAIASVKSWNGLV